MARPKPITGMGGRLAARLYGFGVALRHHLYRKGTFSRTKLPVPVVSVGNLTAGGTGKTPITIEMARRFMETGRCWVKISAPYLASTDGPPHYADVGDKVRALVAVRPDRLVWAVNWPHPNHTPGNKPEEADCLDVLLDWVPDTATRNAILADNPAVLYDFDD